MVRVFCFTIWERFISGYNGKENYSHKDGKNIFEENNEIEFMI
jgi:hypothetical protein